MSLEGDGGAVPLVASVGLVASAARAAELAPWLRSWGVPVGYALELHEPTAWAPTRAPAYDVTVIDGASIATDVARVALLHDAGVHRERLATLLYVCRRVPSRVELEHASLWCDDLIGDEGPFGPRLRQRVQALALAPWRRALVARVEAERRGQARLRLVRGAAPASPRARG